MVMSLNLNFAAIDRLSISIIRGFLLSNHEKAMDGLRAIERFLTIVPSDRSLLLEAAVFLFFARLALAVLPFQTISNRLKRGERAPTLQSKPYDSASGVALAIARAARVIPRSTCLTQALAGTMMLNRRGHAARLCIGVSKHGEEFGAHAWVECGGAAVVGSGTGFSRIVTLPGARL